MAPLADSSLVARRLGTSPKILVASPTVARDLPESLEDGLARFGYVAHAAVAGDHVELTRDEQSLRVATSARATANSAESQVALLEAGAGIALMPRRFVRDALAAGRLQRVYPEYRGGDLPLYVVYPAKRLMPARVARFVPLLEERVRHVLR